MLCVGGIPATAAVPATAAGADCRFAHVASGQLCGGAESPVSTESPNWLESSVAVFAAGDDPLAADDAVTVRLLQQPASAAQAARSRLTR